MPTLTSKHAKLDKLQEDYECSLVTFTSNFSKMHQTAAELKTERSHERSQNVPNALIYQRIV